MVSIYTCVDVGFGEMFVMQVICYPPSCTRMDLQLSRQRLNNYLFKIQSSEVQPASMALFFNFFTTFPYPTGNCNKRCSMMNFVKGLSLLRLRHECITLECFFYLLIIFCCSSDL
jgi:hypothetical protein